MTDVTTGTEVDVEVAVIEEPRSDFMGRLGEAARDNPASAALIAMGAVWLFAGGSRVSILGSRLDRRSARRASAGGAAYPAPPVVGLHAEGAAMAAHDAAHETARSTGAAADRAGRAVGRAADAVGEAAGTVAHGVSSAAERTTHALADAGAAGSRAARRTATTAWHEVEDLSHSVREVLEDRPLAIAALGLAAGAGLALALPRTEAERELMGERSEALRERARSAAAHGIEEAREGGEAALSRAVRDARAHGLTETALRAAVDEFAAKIEKVALAARDAAKDEAKSEEARS